MDDSLRELVRRLRADPHDAALALSLDEFLDRLGRWREERPELRVFEDHKPGNRCTLRASCMEPAVTEGDLHWKRPTGRYTELPYVVAEIPVWHDGYLEVQVCVQHTAELMARLKPTSGGILEAPRPFPGLGLVIQADFKFRKDAFPVKHVVPDPDEFPAGDIFGGTHFEDL